MAGWALVPSGMALALLILLPLALKWELERKTVLGSILLVGAVSGALVRGLTAFYSLGFRQILLLQIALIVLLSFSLLLWRFYRDPERTPPQDRQTILSPADGRVIYVKTVAQGQVPVSEKAGSQIPLAEFLQSAPALRGGYLVGISMSYLDVHVNRAPVGGKITLLRYIKGRFRSLKGKDAVFQNERQITVIDRGDMQVAIVQIASRLVRKIVSFVEQGQEVQQGARIGLIRFGSQVDLLLPDHRALRLLVAPGMKVTAGLSIIATTQ